MAETGKKPLLAAYLVVGSDELKRRRVLARLRERISELGDIDFNSDTFEGSSADGAAIVDACNTLPFASDLRLVQVNAADKLGKAAAEALVAYLGHPCETTVLALQAEKLAKNTRLYKAVAAVGKHAVIDCEPVKAAELPTFVRNMAPGHGITITPSAAQKLVELVGADTVRIDAELRKLAIAHSGVQPVGEAEVEASVARTAELKPWDFTDAFADRDLRRCLKVRPLIPSTGPIQLLGMCTTRLRELACAKSLEARGQGARLAAELGLPDWRVKRHRTWARKFTMQEIEHALVTARDCEKAMKSGADQEAAFQEWLLAALAPRSTR